MYIYMNIYIYLYIYIYIYIYIMKIKRDITDLNSFILVCYGFFV